MHNLGTGLERSKCAMSTIQLVCTHVGLGAHDCAPEPLSVRTWAWACVGLPRRMHTDKQGAWDVAHEKARDGLPGRMAQVLRRPGPLANEVGKTAFGHLPLARCNGVGARWQNLGHNEGPTEHRPPRAMPWGYHQLCQSTGCQSLPHVPTG